MAMVEVFFGTKDEINSLISCLNASRPTGIDYNLTIGFYFGKGGCPLLSNNEASGHDWVVRYIVGWKICKDFSESTF